MAVDGLREELGSLTETDDSQEAGVSHQGAQRSINAVSGVTALTSVEEQSAAIDGAAGQNASSLPKVPSWLKGAAQVVIGAAALVYIISKSDSHELLEALKTARLWYVPLTIGTTVIVYWLMAYR